MIDAKLLPFVPALVVGVLLCGPSSMALAQPGWGYGPMGRGMMHDWTPEQRRQHWEQMRQYGQGPGMMWDLTPEERERHWQWMRERGYGPGMMGPGMMGPGPMGGGAGAAGSQAGQPSAPASEVR